MKKRVLICGIAVLTFLYLDGCSAVEVEPSERVSKVAEEQSEEEQSEEVTDAKANEEPETEASEEVPSESNAKEDESVLKDTKVVDEEGEALQNATTGQKQAYKKALSYLRFTSFSYPGLIEQLEFDGFSTEDATFAVDNCGADWNEQAVNKGKSYLSFTSFSKDGLIEQLEHDGFTSEEALQAADQLFEASADNGGEGNVSKDNALEKAGSYLRFTSFSYSGLIEQLEHDGFSAEDAAYGADNCGADWNEQAMKKAKSYLDFTYFSKDKLISQLEHDGFTHEQAVYGAEQNGF